MIHFVRGCDETTAIVMALDMMFAGIDTSSHTSSYAMFQLAKHPEVQEKLYREIKKELPDKVKYERTRDWSSKFATGLNMIIGSINKVYKSPGC